MKTSLIIEDSLFKAAKKEAEKTNTSVSETITQWARVGKEVFSKSKSSKRPKLKTVDLGDPAKIDLNSRRNWMDLLHS